MEHWPNFFIVGAPKAGTTSLYEYLKDVPGIYMSPIKEPNFFSENTIRENYPVTKIRKNFEYLELFEGAKEEKILGEASTTYLSDPEVSHKIHNINPRAYILISLRDPVERAFSHYLMHIRTTWLTSSFNDELKKSLSSDLNLSIPHLKLEHGLYFDDVKRYLDIFGTKQVKIIIFEEWATNIEQTIQEILIFLGLTISKIYVNPMIHNEYEMFRGKISKHILRNKTIGIIAKATMTKSQRDYIRNKLYKKGKKPKMDETDRKILIDYYKDDVRKLENLLGRKLPWTNFIV
jgi:hypothetical protein